MNYKNSAKILSCAVNPQTYEGAAEIDIGGKNISCFVFFTKKEVEKLKTSKVELYLSYYRKEKRLIKVKNSGLENTIHVKRVIVIVPGRNDIIINNPSGI